MIIYLMNRLYFSTYRFERNLSMAIYYLIRPLMKWLVGKLLDTSWMNKRLTKQKQTKEKAIHEGFTVNEDIEDIKCIVESDGTMITIGFFLASIIIMLPQCIIRIPYIFYLISHPISAIILIGLIFGLGNLILHITIWQNDKYVPYFQKFTKESKTTRICWHVTNIFILVLLVICWIYLFKYCRSLWD